MVDLGRYRSLVFDCDGVVLDSNRLKTEAFRRIALPWGTAAAEALVAYHTAHGGIARQVKFTHFIAQILPNHAAPGSLPAPPLEALLEAYAAEVRAGLMTCAAAEGLEALRAATPGARWLIVSGGDQTELRGVFAARGLATHFDGGIFGSPDNKDRILARELAAGTIPRPALFLGDSRYDHEAAARAGLDFVFVSAWSEFAGWTEHVTRYNLHCVPKLIELLSSHAPGD